MADKWKDPAFLSFVQQTLKAEAGETPPISPVATVPSEASRAPPANGGDPASSAAAAPSPSFANIFFGDAGSSSTSNAAAPFSGVDNSNSAFGASPLSEASQQLPPPVTPSTETQDGGAARIETEIQILKQQELKRKALDDEIKKVQAENEKLKKELSYSWIYFFALLFCRCCRLLFLFFFHFSIILNCVFLDLLLHFSPMQTHYLTIAFL